MSATILPVRSPQAIARAVELLQAGQLVIIPTETIYGIAALPDNTAAIARLYEVRGRLPEPAAPFLLANVDYMNVLARPNRTAWRLARHFWPGSLTLILPPHPDSLSPSRRASPVALRVPDFSPLMPLLEKVGGSLFVSGAICRGNPPAITAQEAATLFAADVALILDGGHALFGIPSTILDCLSDPPQIRRRGVIAEEKIRGVLGGNRLVL
ncbi:MAG TPA: L-threonylcarbamoyladenylate synthase [Anaerolineae bacterium]|nr:L-threonylcarbamoyladenylate synthase [Anaerolineae bacterium]HQH39536.1 L-threonylcarbamoyladenylate synthase [Anaerolineae bacterium]